MIRVKEPNHYANWVRQMMTLKPQTCFCNSACLKASDTVSRLRFNSRAVVLPSLNRNDREGVGRRPFFTIGDEMTKYLTDETDIQNESTFFVQHVAIFSRSASVSTYSLKTVNNRATTASGGACRST